MKYIPLSKADAHPLHLNHLSLQPRRRESEEDEEDEEREGESERERERERGKIVLLVCAEHA